MDMPSGRHSLVVPSGISLYWLLKAKIYERSIPAAWGGVGRILSFPLDEPTSNSEAIEPEIRAGNAWIEKWNKPQGICDNVVVGFARDSSMLGYVSWGVPTSAGTLTEMQRTKLRLIAPHFRRAISISKLLDMKAMVNDTFASSLDRFTIGIVLVDAGLTIIHANLAALEMLQDRDPIADPNGRIALQNTRLTEALLDAVQRAAGVALGQRGIGIPVKRRDTSPALVHVMPLRSSKLVMGLSQRAVAAVFVAPASAPPQMPAAALALLYDLTPAETRVLELIVQGLAPAEIAKQLGVTLATTKTHLQRVFDKTGHSRQADLVRLVGSLVLPV
jgi:DNA-binding CsgD family transcriptional regulator